jgi:predicted transcriptional regulator
MSKKKQPKPLSEELREAREALGIRQAEAAKRAGIGGETEAGRQAAWSALESGRLDPKDWRIKAARRGVGLE